MKCEYFQYCTAKANEDLCLVNPQYCGLRDKHKRHTSELKDKTEDEIKRQELLARKLISSRLEIDADGGICWAGESE